MFSNRKPFKAPDGEEAPKKRKPRSAQSYMIWLLSRREYSEAELRKKLELKEFPKEEIDAAIAFAQKHKFQSDERFAHMKANSNAHRHGNYRLKRTLMEKGISEELAEAQVQELAPEEERAVEAARRFESKEFTPELNQKIYRFLAQRGFSGKAIKAAISHLKELAANQE